VLEDVTDRHEAQARLERQRDHDGLTGLLNRSGLMAAIDDALGRPGDADPAVVVIDLDLFAAVNDALGHDAGDRLLLEIAQRLARTAGIEGSVARLAGDQFGVLLTPRDADRRVELVDSLADAVRVEVELRAGEPTYPTASVGVAVARPGWSPKDLTRAAELAMREAKAAGRNRIHWSASDGAELPPATHQLVGELHRALEAGEFVVEFQPIVELPSGRTVGSEALVRWHHPDRGLLPPAAFLPVAEAAGLVGAVGRTVLEEACRRTATWNREIGPMDVSVNAAVAQLSDPCFVDLVQQAITASGLAPERLWIEITESAFISDVGTVSASLRSLRDLGVHLSVDDFGTGYSSLTYLRRFPVESIKVDREFVAGLGADPKDEAIVASVLDLGARLGLRVVAEGVELDRQVQWLRSARCRLAQGYRLGRPMPARALEERLLAESAQPAAGEPAKLSGSPGTG
jgi:diguanylate cyclase (GGDEF)-like protein